MISQKCVNIFAPQFAYLFSNVTIHKSSVSSWLLGYAVAACIRIILFNAPFRFRRFKWSSASLHWERYESVYSVLDGTM